MGNKSENQFSLPAMLVALAACFVSIWQGIETREHYRKTLMPHLVIGSTHTSTRGSIDGGKRPEISVRNSGVGPAFISDVKVFVDDRLMNDSDERNGWDRAAAVLDLYEDWVRFGYFYENDVLQADGRKKLFYTLPSQKEHEELIAFSENFDRIKIEIQYKSVYGQSFVAKYN